MEPKQKWVKENGVFFPIPGDTTLHTTPGNGIFQLYQQKGLGGSRLGLRKMADKFTFNFKVYDLGVDDVMKKIVKTWNSNVFVESDKNLGIIFNGLKGTGKTIASKLLSNMFDMPVVIIPEAYDNILEFIQSLAFECVILIDEAEKTFSDNGDILLKMIDGVYNERRKLYVLTTNRLTIDDNLLGRPGRIRYIKQFGNLTAKAVADYIRDNLHDQTKKNEVLSAVDLLEISTIDILKAIVDEVNIHGCITDNSMLNIPKASYKYDVVCFGDVESSKYEELKTFVKSQLQIKESVGHWLNAFWKNDDDDETLDNLDRIDEMFGGNSYHQTIASRYSSLMKDMDIRLGTIITDPDEYGFFIVRNEYDNEESLCCISSEHGAPSLYRGDLQMWCA